MMRPSRWKLMRTAHRWAGALVRISAPRKPAPVMMIPAADDTRPDPPELPGGQDDPPDLMQLLKVLARELAELRDNPGAPDEDQRLRLGALLAVVRRVLGESNGG
jgi:hypothetical protein